VDFATIIGQRWHTPPAPTLIAKETPTRVPIVVSHLVGATAMKAPTLKPPVEAAYTFHVHHQPLKHSDTWVDGRYAKVPFIPAGGLCLFDLASSPVAWVHDPFDFTRFYVNRATLEDLAYEQNIHFRGELRLPVLGHADPVLEHLSLALISRRRVLGTETDSLFSDWIALAFHAHIVSTYANGARVKSRPKGALPPRRLQHISDWVEQRLNGPLSIAALAGEVGMSPGHFARSFREATGATPHRWLMAKKLERAKTLLLASDLPISQIALDCGFVDQSHLTRAFNRGIGLSPASWRRMNRN